MIHSSRFVSIENALAGYGRRGRGGECRPADAYSGTRSTRTAQTLYSGIFDDGSNAEFVRKFAADSSSFTNGTNTAPGRTASVTHAWPVSSPRRDATRIRGLTGHACVTEAVRPGAV